MTSRKSFFATKSDLLPGLNKFEQNRDIKYVESGLFETPRLKIFSSGQDLPSLGNAPSGDAVHEPTYLVITGSSNPMPRTVRQSKGGIKYAFDPTCCEYSVVFKTGGLSEENALISGEISTLGETTQSKNFFKQMAKDVIKGFVFIKSYWVGPEALVLLNTGYRLTRSIKSPKEFDLAM